jgi:hypothetical protein
VSAVAIAIAATITIAMITISVPVTPVPPSVALAARTIGVTAMTGVLATAVASLSFIAPR